MIPRYLGVKFKDGEYKKYDWDKVDFTTAYIHEIVFFIVRNEKAELLLCTPLENIKYYERIIEEYGD